MMVDEDFRPVNEHLVAFLRLSPALVIIKQRVHKKRLVSSPTMVRAERSRTGGV